MFIVSVFTLLALATFGAATVAPGYGDYNLIWHTDFGGRRNSLPRDDQFNIITGYLGYNAEAESYTRSTSNLRMSGSGTLQIVPQYENGRWTSGRIESKYTFTPTPGRVTRVEASIRFANRGGKQGIWPAFWMLGDSNRHGVSWPLSGEIDIVEVINGQSTGHGTLHCDTNPGGICNESNGIGAAVGFDNNGYNTWRFELDRRPQYWVDETLTWFVNGQQFHQIYGNDIGNEDIWNRVCHSPLFFVLNVAVGGFWVSQRAHVGRNCVY